MSAVTFKIKFPWAMCPEPRRAPTRRQDSDAVESSFRWLRGGRKAGDCGPFNLAANFGWSARSPVDVLLQPFHDLAFICSDNELDETITTLGLAEAWRRHDHYIGIREKLGLRAYDFRVGDHWEVMFLPNGQGSLEWRLGIEVNLPEGFSLLVQNVGGSGFSTISGILPGPLLSRMNASHGLSIAIQPNAPVRIRRGDAIAHLVAIDQATLQVNTGR